MKKRFSLVIGLGKTGLSVARYLKRIGTRFIVFDTRSQPAGLSEFQTEFPEVEIYLEKYDENKLLQAEEFIVSPGVSLTEPVIQQAVKQKISVIGDIELFARVAKAPVVAITGTNAKGTVTTLVAEMAKSSCRKVLVGGNIGTPALDLLTQPVPELYILELSSFQLETTYSLSAIAATILNISPDHLDRHGTLENYVHAKQRIYHKTKNIIYNHEDRLSHPVNNAKQMISFGLSSTANFHIKKINNVVWLCHDKNPLISTNELLIKGQHNWYNALAALALGYAVNLPIHRMLEALTYFPGLPHRCEWIAEKHGITWYNDSKGTNVGATIAALTGLGTTITGKIILIAGGVGKGQDFSLLQNAVKQYVKTLIVYGQDALLIADSVSGFTSIHHVADLSSAIHVAKEVAIKGDAILLSPACASFDMFKNFEHRGEVFKELVKKYYDVEVPMANCIK